jgi:hypothetical protein
VHGGRGVRGEVVADEVQTLVAVVTLTQLGQEAEEVSAERLRR